MFFFFALKIMLTFNIVMTQHRLPESVEKELNAVYHSSVEDMVKVRTDGQLGKFTVQHGLEYIIS